MLEENTGFIINNETKETRHKMVCPFRRETSAQQGSMMNSVKQVEMFPECQYEDCPFYEAPQTCLQARKIVEGNV